VAVNATALGDTTVTWDAEASFSIGPPDRGACHHACWRPDHGRHHYFRGGGRL